MTRTLRLALPILAASALFVFANPQKADAAIVTISIRNNQYIPASATANPGDTVRWVNEDSVPHTVTHKDGAFASGTIAPGQSFSIQVNLQTTHSYGCDFHPMMSGSLTVGPAGAASTAVGLSSEELANQAKQLLDKVAALQAQLGGMNPGAVITSSPTAVGTTVSSANCPLIGRVLKRGSSGDDVMRLQRFLAADPSMYPEAQITGYFGELTEAAVRRWQTKYNIVSSGTPETTGFGVVGPRTAAAISLQCSTVATGGGGQITSPAVGGFIEVSPVTGLAPLAVNVKATVNTVRACSGALYTLDWGDGTIAQNIQLDHQVPSATCAELVRNYSHIYFAGGTYVIRLSSGTHSTTATVVVSGSSAGVPTQTNLPQQTFTASPTSGNAPLTVTFSGTLTGANAGWCQSGCTDTITFGDGTTGTVPLPTASNGWVQYSLQHTYTTQGTYTATHYQGAAGSGRPTVGSPITISVSGSSSSGSLGPLELTPNVGNNPLALNATFNVLCGGTYSLSWGDSTAAETGNANCSSGSSSSLKTLSHTYGTTGAYTITLTRGSRVDSAGIVISN